ncbi:MAG TPA: LCP family protein [Virgibacillus sp.]|nr:LCP family protein [Virgibacillus sp.]
MSDKKTQSRIVRRIRRKKKRSGKKRFMLFILVSLLIVSLPILSYMTYLYIKADSAISESYVDDGREKSPLRDTKVDPSKDHVSVLIIGVDASNKRNNDDDSLSDALMLATLNKKDNSIKMLSIPRDSKVYIPEIGYEDKINHAHSYGGTHATVETVEGLLDIPVDYWVKVNFHAFIDIVDALDGITVDVPYEVYEQDSEDTPNAIHLLPGKQHLNGEEALALARTRKMDNDVERGKRQQEIIKAILKKSIALDSILKYDDIIETVGSNMSTNMTFSEMKSFIAYGTSGQDLDIETLTLEGEDLWVYEPEKRYYWQLDELALQSTIRELRQHLELEDDPSIHNRHSQLSQPERPSDNQFNTDY